MLKRICSADYYEDVIPKNSLLYSAFTVLNEINNIKIDGEEISVELKQGIYKDLFEKSNKVKVFDLKKYLALNGYMNIEITDSYYGMEDGSSFKAI